jgi:alkylation response protein AidB-like acyl-CoA dehydrogenase
MSPDLTPDQSDAVAAAQRFAQRHIAPFAADWERERRLPIEVIRAAGEAELLGLMAPEDSGGRGIGLTGSAAVAEVLAAADMAVTFSIKVHNNFVASMLRNGSPGQIERYVAPMLAGETLGAFLLSEPGAGSDATAITTTARPDGAGWVIDGEKAWITNGVAADLLLVFAQTDPALGWHGIASFLVEAASDGVTRLPAYDMLGGHALGACGLRFEGVRVGPEAMFQPPEKAFKGAMGGINIARVGVGAMCCGMMQNSLDTAIEAARARPVFGQHVADFQGVQWALADAATDLAAARHLTWHAARLFDAGEDATLAAAHAKKFATRAAMRHIAQAMQVMGANGFRHDAGHPLARHLAAAKMAEWLDGATEIQNVVIARSLLRG